MTRRKLTKTLLVVALGATLATLFWPWIESGILHPIARVVWLILRLFVFSLDQGVIWAAVLLVGFVVFLFRLSQSGVHSEPALSDGSYGDDRALSYWKDLLAPAMATGEVEASLKRELVWVLVGIHASKHRLEANYLVTEAFRDRTIPLPEPVCRFLFAPGIKKRFFSKCGRRETVESLTEVLSFLENSLETNGV